MFGKKAKETSEQREKRKQQEQETSRQRAIKRKEDGMDMYVQAKSAVSGVIGGLSRKMILATVWLLIWCGIAAGMYVALVKVDKTAAIVTAVILCIVGSIPFLGFAIQMMFAMLLSGFGSGFGANMGNFAFGQFQSAVGD